jgi:phytanoyl-CoA hydroxylase
MVTAQVTAVTECSIRRTGLLNEHVTAFQRDGVLAIRGLLDEDELAVTQQAAAELVDWSWRTGVGEDVKWVGEPGRPDAKPVRIEYVMDKSPQLRLLAAHPLLLRLAEAIVGPTFIPTWDSMVYKTTSGAPRLNWHRDGEMYPHPVAVTGSGRVIDVGVYLDNAPEDNCVWCLPGSNYWPTTRAEETMVRMNAAEWDTTNAVPALMRPGDVLVHNIMTLHGAPGVGPGKQRRVVYFEYRPAEVELCLGPHDADYVGLKQQVLRACVDQRARARPQEQPFDYRPGREMSRWDQQPPITGYRFSHEEYWTWPGYH